MKHTNAVIPILAMIIIFFLPLPVLGQGSLDNYIVFKGGIVVPTSDLDDGGFDTGFNGGGGFAHYFAPNFLLELEGGYFKSDAFGTGTNALLGQYAENDDISVVPITLTGKGVYSTGQWDLFGGVGVGLYYADFEGNLVTTALGNFRIDDSDTVFGVNLVAGIMYNFTKNMFLGLEGKYFLTGDAEFEGVTQLGVPIVAETNLNSFIATINLGFRF